MEPRIRSGLKRKCKHCREAFTPYNSQTGVARVCKPCRAKANWNKGGRPRKT